MRVSLLGPAFALFWLSRTRSRVQTLNGVVGRERAIAEGAGVLDEERLQIVLRLGLETLLMFLFSRPVGVDYAWNEDVEFAELEITIAGNNQQVVSIREVPNVCRATGALVRRDGRRPRPGCR